MHWLSLQAQAVRSGCMASTGTDSIAARRLLQNSVCFEKLCAAASPSFMCHCESSKIRVPGQGVQTTTSFKFLMFWLPSNTSHGVLCCMRGNEVHMSGVGVLKKVFWIFWRLYSTPAFDQHSGIYVHEY
eukprot:4446697-Amphidinium_carterae.3